MAPVKHPHASKSHRQELIAVHGTMADVRVDPEEHLASATAIEMVQALAQMKSPSDYPQDLTGKI